MLAGSDSQVALSFKGKPPAEWVRVGEDFYGYRVKGFDMKKQRVGIEDREGHLYVLGLEPGAKVTHGKELPPGARVVIQNNLSQLSFAMMMFFQQKGSEPTFDDLIPLVPKIRVVDGEDYRGIKYIHGQTISVTTAGGIVVRQEPEF
jgi:hypothetical protein